MTFSVDDYEKAIARIFQGEHVIGTGFLVAPGYVMTCAHVVLQAIGIEKGNFASYQGQPQERVSLDFHVLATGQLIEAEVVAWLAYSIEIGDVAVLRLLSPEPEGVRSIPLVEVLRDQVEADRHFVYGFGGGKLGGRSDAYRPKANAAGGRFQLCKDDGSNDETIKPGFSGAPVWNEARKCVIGMVATAVVTKDEQQSTAYAIPTKALRPVLKQIEAFYLHDVLMQSLEGCNSDEQKRQLTIAIAATFRQCNLQEDDRYWQKQLVELSTNRPPVRDWEQEGNLVRFAILLAKMEDTPPHVYVQLKTWVECCNLKFSDLLDRLTLEIKTQKIPLSHVCQHLMVVVDQEGTSTHELRVSLWQVADRETYNPKQIELDKLIAIAALPQFIRKQIRKFRQEPKPTIHLFVPRSLFGCDIEMLPSSKRGQTLGSEYPFVVRTNLTTHPIDYCYYDSWNDKWNAFEETIDQPTDTVFQSIDCSQAEEDLVDELEHINAAVLQGHDSVGELFDLISEQTALPVALWSRDPNFQGSMTEMLDCIVKTLHDRIRQKRDIARQAKPESLLGHHLSLVWEDPKIVPPDMLFDPEAC
jgi:vWA-MoxR associated protein C-terminal domain/Trypsin-like peptidase domain/vWA-MoxR associated protein middle region (VMAP-M) 1